MEFASAHFVEVYDYFAASLAAHGQPSVTWMEIPVRGRMHITSCDLSSLVSTEMFVQWGLPAIRSEVAHMTHNVFHVDGKGVARHLDVILSLPEVQAVQWVQGVGKDEPILQWATLIERIRGAGKGVVVELRPAELEAFLEEIGPQRIYFCIGTWDEDQEIAILKRLSRRK